MPPGGNLKQRQLQDGPWNPFAAAVAFHPDGTRLAAAFRDGTFRLWLGMPSSGSHNR